jgi:hypothetical protein
MVRRMGWKGATVAVLALALAAGCGGDMVKQLLSNPELQGKVMDAISANSGMAGQMVDRLLASDSTRTLVMDKMLANGGAAQAMMSAVAKDQTMMDGVIGLAVQDSSMRAHVLTLFKGMQMAGGAK